MTPRALLPCVVTAALPVLLVTACTGGAPEYEQRPEPSAERHRIAVDPRPHFEGERAVVLAVGRLAPAVGTDSCRDEDAPIWVCDRDAQDRYLVGQRLDATLREARMDVADGGTSWTVSLRFRAEDRRDVVTVGEGARDRDAFALVLDDRREVLVVAPSPDVDHGVLRLPGLTRSEAWDTVETLAVE